MKFKVKKKYGQHFLQNNKVIREITSLKNLNGKNIIEIGPGFGSLTVEILKMSPKILICIEKDQTLKPYLEKIKKNNKVRFKVIYDDALDINLNELKIKNKIILLANLPYNIATTLIMKWLRYINIFESIIVMIQSEVAQRLTAKVSSKFYGRVSVLVQLHSFVKEKILVKPENFYPKPKVTSSVIEIIPKKKINFNYNEIDFLLKHSFQHRRKKIKNNLKNIYPNIHFKLTQNGLNENARPQDISPENYINLCRSLQ